MTEPISKVDGFKSIPLPDIAKAKEKNILEITMDDINGKLFEAVLEGDDLAVNKGSIIYIPAALNPATVPYEHLKHDTATRVDFLILNAQAQVEAINGLDITKSLRIAYIKLLIVTAGLASPKFDKKNNHVKYNECIQVTGSQAGQFSKDKGGVSENELKTALTGKWLFDIGKVFNDLICLVAYVFRTRGHHFLDSYSDKYNDMLGKIGMPLSQIGLTLKELFYHSVHAIFPILLDGHWKRCVENSRCSGALTKRYNCPIAGTAGVYVLFHGLQDLIQVAPGIKTVMKESIEYLEELYKLCEAGRYDGGINSIYYGGKKIKIVESRISAIASLLSSALQALADDSPMLKSPALQRIAHIAPLTGAVYAKALSQLPTREELVETMATQQIKEK